MTRWLVIGAALWIGGCDGVIGDRSGGVDPSGSQCGRSVCGATGELAAATAFPRLTHAQWENTVQDFLRLAQPPNLAGTFEPDTRVSFFDNNAKVLRISGDLWSDYQAAAEQLADAVTADAAALERLLPAELPVDPAQQAHAVVSDLGRRAYRRSLSAEELDAHEALFAQGPTHFPEMDPLSSGVRVLLEALLQSPHFLYRVEIGKGRTGDSIELTDFEIASRLSYMIWNTMPDDALLAEAERSALHEPEQVAAQASRLLADPRGQQMVERFHSQLLNWDLYRHLSKDPIEFPLSYEGVGDDMYEEARLFVQSVVLEESGNLAELLTAPYTFANAGLAAIYRIQGPFNDTFSRASFDPVDQPERGGLLTQLGFLASHGGLTGSIHRGVFVNHRILCTELPPPPDAVPPIPADSGQTMTSRERIEMHTGPGTCGASCHGTFINPVGFAFESFDGLGQYRTEELGIPIDASASFEFEDGPVSYDGAAEFTGAVADRVQAHDCYAKHWVEYALGRSTAGSDLDLIQKLGDASLGGLAIEEMILELVGSEEFRVRNAEGS